MYSKYSYQKLQIMLTASPLWFCDTLVHIAKEYYVFSDIASCMLFFRQ